MKTFSIVMTCIVVLLTLACPLASHAEEPATIVLPAPRMEGGMPLMQALKERKSMRDYDEKMLPDQVLSDLLWAGFGINRPESGMRTAASARNWQDLDIFVATANGVFLYDAKNNQLKEVAKKDLREMTGMQDFVKNAPINLIFVSDYARMQGDENGKRFMAAAHTGSVSQNVYLFCASEGLATVVRAGANREALAKELGLREDQKITLLQTVGYPKKQ